MGKFLPLRERDGNELNIPILLQRAERFARHLHALASRGEDDDFFNALLLSGLEDDLQTFGQVLSAFLQEISDRRCEVRSHWSYATRYPSSRLIVVPFLRFRKLASTKSKRSRSTRINPLMFSCGMCRVGSSSGCKWGGLPILSILTNTGSAG